MLAQEIIRRKRDGRALAAAEIQAFVRGLTDGSWSEGQVAALAMAMTLQGMSAPETVELTRAMTASGQTLDWGPCKLQGPILDKHSSGGVGDKVSLMLGPMVAACGGFVPMISGRGLGHTGGTLDKLDSIPGYCTAPDLDTLRRAFVQAGCVIVGQTAEVAPADRRLYAIRDVTATVESVALITGSILSKKLAAGLQGLVMDVKLGNGAFASDHAMARALGDSIVEVACAAGLPTRAWITDMNQVLGDSVGNAVEVLEAVAFLRGDRQEPRLRTVTVELCAEMLHLGGLAPDVAAGRLRADEALSSGRALECFARMVAALGGPADFCMRPQAHLRRAAVECPVPALADGVVCAMATRDLGLEIIVLGGGRRVPSDRVDHAVGLSAVVPLGRTVVRGEPLAVVHAATEEAARHGVAAVQRHMVVGEVAPAPTSVLLERLAHRA